jgi:large subunit ribosomal protein L3
LQDVFAVKQFVDVRAVTHGKGMEGVVQRHNVKTQRRKAKTERIVGSIGPWHPATVMHTVARPGQFGYHTRTEYNKRVLMIGSMAKELNPSSGFKNFGLLKNDAIVVAGSVPGVPKRCIALRSAIRQAPEHRAELAEIEFVSVREEKAKGAGAEEEFKTQRLRLEKEAKAEKKSVEEEIAEAAKKKAAESVVE